MIEDEMDQEEAQARERRILDRLVPDVQIIVRVKPPGSHHWVRITPHLECFLSGRDVFRLVRMLLRWAERSAVDRKKRIDVIKEGRVPDSILQYEERVLEEKQAQVRLLESILAYEEDERMRQYRLFGDS